MAQLSLKVEIDKEKFQEMIEQFKKENPDFIEVVRCKDCICWDIEHKSKEGLAKCLTGESGIRYRASTDFCSKGEKHKENN